MSSRDKREDEQLSGVGSVTIDNDAGLPSESDEPSGEPNAVTGDSGISFRADDNDGSRERTSDTRTDRDEEVERPYVPPQAEPLKRRRSSGRLDDASTAIGGIVVLVSASLADRLGPEWYVTPDEANQLGKATVKLLNRAPIPSERIGLGLDLMAFVGAIGAVFGVRYVVWKRNQTYGISPEQAAAADKIREMMHQQAQSPNGTAAMPDGLEVSE